MPRKTKEQKELENEEKSTKKVATSKTAKTKTSSSKASSKTTKTAAKKTTAKAEPTKKTTTRKSTTKKEPAKKTDTKKAAAKKESAKTTRKTTVKKETDRKTTTKKVSTKKEPAKKSTTKKATTKRSATKKETTKKTTRKTTTKRSTTRKGTKKVAVVEYYDLPYRYNQTVVKVLAQTPTNLFIYWDIADSDRKNFEEQYGENFFETTRPILIVHNDTLGYSFEVEINDFANSWYLHVADSKCDYRIELGRRPIIKTEELENTDYIYIATSNNIESPNDKVLIDQLKNTILFRNVKTGEQHTKSINTMLFIRNMGRIYNIYDLYKAIYNGENIEEIYDLSNPSSRNPSSGTFSSSFRK